MLQPCVLKCNITLTTFLCLRYDTRLRTGKEYPNDKTITQDRHEQTLIYSVKTEQQVVSNLYKYKIAQRMSPFDMTKKPILQAKRAYIGV